MKVSLFLQKPIFENVYLVWLCKMGVNSGLLVFIG